jgi:hypothetical protein
MNIQLLGYRKYYTALICNRICNHNKGVIKNRIFWGGRLGGAWPVDTSNNFGQHEFVLPKVSISINVPDTTSYKLLSSHSSSADPMANCALNVQVLQASVDPDDESHFRILVGGKFIKYLTSTLAYTASMICASRLL